ncbi:galactose mutarotase [Pseudomaricurvus alkylphenolicus]|uniref:aldose epimerase family protein n=1 Tax=Pseudomaricurvus alkylphenolicus TaxID=1306991 RepID=UPI0014212758|nr:aldose epimerase family protein [Pseudomaricurvus alkylphenolicus]NIB41548.1 galactose mutarotase [Pseudomaricurvus alkylphenolicus]
MIQNPSVEASELRQFRLQNQQGASVCVLNFGARLTELNIPTRRYGTINTILGFDHPETYLQDAMFHGAIAGRYCNRIGDARFTLNGKVFELPANNGKHHLHGGHGFADRIWQLQEKAEHYVVLTLSSEDGDQGYPGNLSVELRYLLNDDNGLEVQWRARSDQDTIVGLTNHSYFNLAGHGDISSHQLRIAADHYTPVDAELIPTGEIAPVENTVFDLRQLHSLAPCLNGEIAALQATDGFDHNWARGRSGAMLPSAELYCPDSELRLLVSSTLPGIQCYTGNALGKTGFHGSHEGICLETQFYPDSPNQTGFPSPVLKAGETMAHTTLFQFSD